MISRLIQRKARCNERPIDAQPFQIQGAAIAPGVAVGSLGIIITQKIRLDVNGLRISDIYSLVFSDGKIDAGLRKQGTPYDTALYGKYWGAPANSQMVYTKVFALYEPGDLLEWVVDNRPAGGIACPTYVFLSGWYF